MNWRCEYWYVSGVHTGWRIVRGSGFDAVDAEYDSCYAFDWTKPGDYAVKLAEANKRFLEINA